ncbi:MAG: gamma-glutamyl phosphate reductase [Phycisphaeraceae bacterium]|nr:MAG: gamma-glutamyl phosphate reductase [Phycisphaeraceae bacterium]
MARTIEDIARGARGASRVVAALDAATKNAVLHDLALVIEDREPEILAANAEDIGAAEKAGLDGPKLKRLKLTVDALAQMRAGLVQIANLPDPVGEVTRGYEVPSGLRVERVRAPLGVIAMIYEARPGVTVDAFALCFKAGNACILKGGREATHSNEVLSTLVRAVLAEHGVPADAMCAFTSSDRDEMKRMLGLVGDIDLVIPRGGAGLIRFVHEHAKVPTVQHFEGVCHVYVDERADLDKALEIVATGKTSAPATCNSTECVLIHAKVADAFLPRLRARADADGVELREGDYGTEFLDLILSYKVVPSMDDAVAHIHEHTSNHTESIVTEDSPAAERFCRAVQSSCVLVNASTRFNDGFQLGLGAEIGISTSRIHAYGPMGLEELTCQRWVVRGDGQTR